MLNRPRLRDHYTRGWLWRHGKFRMEMFYVEQPTSGRAKCEPHEMKESEPPAIHSARRKLGFYSGNRKGARLPWGQGFWVSPESQSEQKANSSDDHVRVISHIDSRMSEFLSGILHLFTSRYDRARENSHLST